MDLEHGAVAGEGMQSSTGIPDAGQNGISVPESDRGTCWKRRRTEPPSSAPAPDEQSPVDSACQQFSPSGQKATVATPQANAPPATSSTLQQGPAAAQHTKSGVSDSAGTSSALQALGAAVAPAPGDQQQQQHHHHHSSSMPLELCMFGQVPGDPMVKQVSDFLYKNMTHENVEIEAKLGVLIDKGTGERVYLPVVTETVLDPKDYSWVRFESDMSENFHRFFNELINKIVEERSSSKERFRIHHRHTKEIDELYGKVRVTRDAGTGEIIPGRCILKTRIADLNIFSPSTRFDYRISVNVEEPQQLPVGKPNFQRQKDRITYTHQVLQLDLTKVQSRRGGASPHDPNLQRRAEITHEIELEFIDVKRHLLPERLKVEAGKPNNFYHMIAALVNNCRWLAKR